MFTTREDLIAAVARAGTISLPMMPQCVKKMKKSSPLRYRCMRSIAHQEPRNLASGHLYQLLSGSV